MRLIFGSKFDGFHHFELSLTELKNLRLLVIFYKDNTEQNRLQLILNEAEVKTLTTAMLETLKSRG